MNEEHRPHREDPADFYSQETWDARYAESDRIWSGEPNRRLVEQVEDLAPGWALDVGCGEGADTVWLATRGWRVTALDVSGVALRRTRLHAQESDVTDRVQTLHLDLMAGHEASGQIPGDYDLVSVFFLHVPEPDFTAFHQRMGAAVKPGGRLLVVGHHPDDLDSGVRRPHGPAMLFTPDQVVGALNPDEWEVEVAEAPTREQQGPEGPVMVRDSVVLLHRL